MYVWNQYFTYINFLNWFYLYKLLLKYKHLMSSIINIYALCNYRMIGELHDFVYLLSYQSGITFSVSLYATYISIFTIIHSKKYSCASMFMYVYINGHEHMQCKCSYIYKVHRQWGWSYSLVVTHLMTVWSPSFKHQLCFWKVNKYYIIAKYYPMLTLCDRIGENKRSYSWP